MGEFHAQKQLESVKSYLKGYCKSCFLTDKAFIAQSAVLIHERGPDHTANRLLLAMKEVAIMWKKAESLSAVLGYHKLAEHNIRKHHPHLHDLAACHMEIQMWTLDQLKKVNDCAYFNLILCQSLMPSVVEIQCKTEDSIATLWTSVPAPSAALTESSEEDGVRTQRPRRRRIIEEVD